MIRKWDISDEQVRKRCMEEIIARVDEQEGAEFGMTAAQDIIDIVAQYVGPSAYNLGIEDAKKLLLQKVSDLEVDFDVLRAQS